MIELVLSVAILAVCVIGIAALFLVGMKNNTSSISENSAAQTSHNMYSYITQNALSLGSSAEWQEYFEAIPNSKSTGIEQIQGDVTFAQAPEFGNIYKIGATENQQNENAIKGIYGITFKTGESQDVRGVAQVWKTDGTQNGDFLEKVYFNESEINSENLDKIKENAVAVNMEISFPVEKPYSQREKKQYYFELMNEFNQDASQNFSVPVNDNEFTAEELSGSGIGNNESDSQVSEENDSPTGTIGVVDKFAFVFIMAAQNGGPNSYMLYHYNIGVNKDLLKTEFAKQGVTLTGSSYIQTRTTMYLRFYIGNKIYQPTVYDDFGELNFTTGKLKSTGTHYGDPLPNYFQMAWTYTPTPYPNGLFKDLTITSLTVQFASGGKNVNVIIQVPATVIPGLAIDPGTMGDILNDYVFIKMDLGKNGVVEDVNTDVVRTTNSDQSVYRSKRNDVIYNLNF